MTGTDTAGNLTVVIQTMTVDATLPTIAIDNGSADTTNDQTPTVAGTTNATPGGQVTVTVNAGSPIQATVQADGTWNTTLTSLSPGTYTIVASVSDTAQNIGSFTQLLTIDIVAPTLTIDGGLSRTTGDATPTISGTSTGATAGSTVSVSVDGQSLSTVAAAGGTWTVTAAHMNNVTRVVAASVTDAAGNVGSGTQSLTINADLSDDHDHRRRNRLDDRRHTDDRWDEQRLDWLGRRRSSRRTDLERHRAAGWIVERHVRQHRQHDHDCHSSVTNPDGNVGAAFSGLDGQLECADDHRHHGWRRALFERRHAHDLGNDRRSRRTDHHRHRGWPIDAGPRQCGNMVCHSNASSLTEPHRQRICVRRWHPGSANQSLTIDTAAPLVVLPGGRSVDNHRPDSCNHRKWRDAGRNGDA